MTSSFTWLRRAAIGGACALASSTARSEVKDSASVSVTAATAADSPDLPQPVAPPAEPAHADSGANDPHRLAAQNTMEGSTGLIRTIAADSGGMGTLRFGAEAIYYAGSGFLCNPVCGHLTNGSTSLEATSQKDHLRQLGTRLTLSVTPAEFLEAYGALRYQGTFDDQGYTIQNGANVGPNVIEIMGNMTFGLKAFLPPKPGRVLTFGGAVDTTLISSAGSVGVDAAQVGIRALGTADFTRQPPGNTRIPLRIHLNAGYLFDGSGTIADDVEKQRAAQLGVREAITRIERFGHDINRVDSFRIGLGAEGVFAWVHPFAEWSIDLPVNRQGYTCHILQKSTGDNCLTHVDFGSVPSRVTLGARIYPWATSWLEGLSGLLAFDIGTGATSSFLEEVAPELPWEFHFGIAYAVDAVNHGAPMAPKVVEKVVRAPLPPLRYVDGVVKVAGKDEPIAGAIVRYVGQTITGMVTDDQGAFRTTDLEPGDYKFAVTAQDYKDGECTATIPAAAPTAPAPAGAPADGKAAPPAPTTGTDLEGKTPPIVVRVSCELEALPRTATINGIVRDSETTMFVSGASASITDPLGRQLSLATDAEGAFRFANVPAGKSKVAVEADGYLRAVSEVTLEPRHDISIDISLYPKPKTPNVVITKTELKLKKEVHFLHGSAELLPDSMAILEEVADVLRTHTEIGNLEVQGHTDDSGTPDFNLKLSADRANAVRDVLVTNGVDPARLTAHGYGQEKPLVPNTSPKNKAKNRRVQLVVLP